MKFLKDALTGIDNQTFSGPKVAGFAVVCTFLGLAIADLVMNKRFDPQAFGVGAGAAIAAMGVAIKMAETSEPK
ncbi:MAG: hypothetical protein NVSMB70_01680 [Chamaesiphon sp.]